jgi:hypothetical protein
MKVQDIIRSVLDIIDQAEQQEKPSMTVDLVTTAQDGDDELRRIQQVVDLLTGSERPTLANSPDERYADIDAVTTDAGGGVNGPKHPADIRGEHPSLYPGKVYGAR